MIYQDKSQIIKPTCPAMLQYHETKKTYTKKQDFNIDIKQLHKIKVIKQRNMIT